jgi:hypothetical protein
MKYKESRRQEPNLAITQKVYIQLKEGNTNSTGLNSVTKPNVKQSNIHQKQSSKSNTGPVITPFLKISAAVDCCNNW